MYRWSLSRTCPLPFPLLSEGKTTNQVRLSTSPSALLTIVVCLSRIATFFASASLSGAFSGLLVAVITQMDGIGGRPGWAWIFILVRFVLSVSERRIYVHLQEGLFTFLFGIISFFGLPQSPAHACFLNDDERSYLVQKLKSAGARSKDESMDGFSWREVVKSIQSPQVWLVSILLFMNGTSTIVHFLSCAGTRKQERLSIVLHCEFATINYIRLMSRGHWSSASNPL